MKPLLHLLLFFSLSFLIKAQQKIDFDFDYAQFAFDSSSNYLEIYYSFGQRGLAQNQNDSAVFLEGILDIEITDTSSHKVIVDKEWKIQHAVLDTSDMNRSLVGVVSFIVPWGAYSLNISGRNSLDSAISRNYKESIRVDPFIDSTFAISNIQLASKILQESTNQNSVFHKNSYEVVPLPTSIFGENQPVVFHYYELYNLLDVNSDVPLKLSVVVLNSRRNVFFNKSKEIARTTDSRVEVGTILVNKYPTDTYTLIVSLVDSINNYGVSSAKKFYVLNPSVVMNDSIYNEITDVFATHFGAMSEEELDDLFKKSKYIATSQEIEQYNSLSSIEGKQKFIHQFWNARDTEPSTQRNEFYLEYLRRIEISNNQFASLGKKGWETDRGRIFLKYGEPSEIERFPNQIDTKPYEIWHYNEIEGGIVFVFADLTTFSDYQLIHSSARGELRDDNWFRRIRSI
jgi:GWxTD domain-containing protein